MFTIKPLGTAQEAGHYYMDQDNYYLTEQETLENMTSWGGKGAEKLGLKGAVEKEQFLSLLEGRLPSGQVLGIVREKDKREHRTGTDVTLSAPKSVSLLALTGNDERLLKAHKKAVQITLERIEKMASEARKTVNGKVEFEKTDNLTVAMFQHTTSRELDENLHTHLVILNMTQRKDGLWRALSSKGKTDKDNLYNGFRQILYDNQHFFGLVYMSTLAKEVKALGFDIDIKDQYGNFEISGVSKEYIERSSKRRTQILEHLEEREVSGARAAEIANLDSREAKQHIDSDSLKSYWDEKAGSDKEKICELINKSKERGESGTTQTELTPISNTIIEALDDALEHLSQYNGKITHADLVQYAFIFAVGKIEHTEIEQEISNRLSNKSLLGKQDEFYTTKSLLSKERQFASSISNAKGASFSKDIKKSGIAAAILKNTDRIQVIDVKSFGAEKRVIENIIATNDENRTNTYVLHQSRLRADLLKDEVKRDSSTFGKWFRSLFRDDIVHTIASFSSRYEQHVDASLLKKWKDIIVIHGAQKLSYDEIVKLDTIAAKSESKLVLLNNVKEAKGFQPGNPLKIVKEQKVACYETQSNKKELECSINETKSPKEDVIKCYLDKIPNKQRKTVIIAPSKTSQDELNEQFRDELKGRGLISHQEKRFKCLSTNTLSSAQKKRSKFYAVGDVVTENAFTKNEVSYRIVEKKNGVLIGVSAKGERKTLPIDGNHTVFKQKEISVSVGDKLAFNKRFQIQKSTIEKGDEFVVEKITDKGVTFALEAKRESKLSLNNSELADTFVTHAYVKTPNQLAGKFDKALLVARPNQLNQALINEISKNAQTTELFTEDKQQVIKYLDKSSVSWTINEIVQGQKDVVKRDSRFIDSIIEKDISILAKALCEDNSNQTPEEVSKQAVAYAVAKCAEHDAAFSHKELLTNALMFAIGTIDHRDVAKELNRRIKEGDLLYMDTHWTTRKSLEIEKEIIECNRSSQGILPPVVNDKNELLSINEKFTQGQKDAVTLALTNKDRFITVQGLAGVGKTTMMKEVQRYANTKGVSVFGLTPTHQARIELTKSGITSQTVDAFLIENKSYPEKSVFIVDEVSMIGNANYRALQKRAIELDIKLVFTGDLTQIQSIPAGVPHELTIKTKSQQLAQMNDIVRQNPNPTLKEAAYHASKAEIDKSMKAVESINPDDHIKRNKGFGYSNGTSIIEIKAKVDKENMTPNYGEIYNAIASDYLSRIPEHREKTLVIAHVNSDRVEIDGRIREGLQQQNIVEKNDFLCRRLTSKYIDKADLCFSKSFREGDVLRFDRTYSVAKTGDYFKVLEVNNDTNTLVCDNQKGATFTINPAKIAEKASMSVYEEGSFPIAKGDTIRTKRTDKKRGIVANTEYKVKDITEGNILLENGKEKITLNNNNDRDRHWDYAYTNTAHTIQGGTDMFTIELELNARKKATTHRSHNIDITRASHQTTIYTEDKEELIKRLNNLKKQDDADKKSSYLVAKAFQDKSQREIISPKVQQKTTENDTLKSNLEDIKSTDISASKELRNLSEMKKHIKYEPLIKSNISENIAEKSSQLDKGLSQKQHVRELEI